MERGAESSNEMEVHASYGQSKWINIIGYISVE